MISLFPGITAAATYNLPADIASPPFNCSGSGPYTCGGITLQNDVVNVNAEITLNLGNNKFDIKKNVTINRTPGTLTINAKDIKIEEGSSIEADLNATSKVDIKKNVMVTGNITAKDIALEKNSSITGNLVATDKVDIKKEALITGNITADEIDIDKNTSITGDLRAAEIKIDKDASIDGNVFAEDKLDIKNNVTITGTCPPWNYSACLGAVNSMVNPTVQSQVTTDSTPIITGTFTSSAAFRLTVTVNSVTYTLAVDSELTNSGDNWTLDLSNITPFANGTYDVDAISWDGSTFFTDNTSGELVIGPLVALDHFAINVGGGAANACSPFPITITAEDGGNNPVTDYTGTVSITTSTSNGSFGDGDPVAPTNGLNPDPDNDDNGSVGYSFDTADNGVINLTISNPRIESLTITVNDAAASVSNTSSMITFAEAGFDITDNDPGVVKGPVAGRNHSYTIEAVRLDPVNGCGTASNYDGLRSIKVWRVDSTTGGHPADPSTTNPTLGGLTVGTAEPASGSNLTFAAGFATVDLDTSDVGLFELRLKDDSGFVSGDMLGSTAVLLIRPFSLYSSNLFGLVANPGATTVAGTEFQKAGANFTGDVSAVLWQSADDDSSAGTETADDGIRDSDADLSDNNLAPGFTWATTLDRSTTGFTPIAGVGGAVGTLSGGNLSAVDFTSGSTNGIAEPTLQYSEVGSFTLTTNANDYLVASFNVDLDAPEVIVGRFTPASFRVDTINAGAFEQVCNSTFTYIGEPFGYSTLPNFVVTALAADGSSITANYLDTFARLGFSGASLSIPSVDAGSGVGVSRTAAIGSQTAGPNAGQVTLTFGTDTWRFGPASPATFAKTVAPLAPFDANLPILVTALNDGDTTTAFSAGSEPNITPTGNNQRWGRLEMTNTNGSELVDLEMPVTVEIFDASGNFTRHTADACTTIVVGDLLLTDNLTGGISNPSVVNTPFASAGTIDYRFSPPGSGNDGYIDVETDLSSLLWLRDDWDADGVYDNNPTARATFGIFRGNDVQIYMQQVYP